MKTLIFSILGLVFFTSPVFSQTITVTKPASNSIFKAGDPITIEWTASGISGNVHVYLVRSGGSVSTLDDNISPGSSPLTVNLQEAIPPDTYKIRISQVSNSTINGESQDFYINAKHSGINIQRPYSGSRFTWGIQEEIKWVRIGLASDLKVSLSLLKGNTFKGSIVRLLSGTRYTWTVPSLPAGDDYRIKISLDPGGLQRIGGNPNVYSKTSSNFRIASTLPDLSVYSMKVTPPDTDETVVKFRASIENLSPFLQAGQSKAVLKISQGSFSMSRVLRVPAINKKSFAEINTSYILPRSGTYIHTLLLNYDSAFEEASRANNKKAVTKTIQYLPDLLLAVYVSDSTPRIFKNTYFHIDVKNIGKHVSTPVEMSFHLNGKKTKTYQIPALQPNQKKYFERSVKYSTKGKRNYRITVDTQNTLREMKKSNNVVEGSIWVLLPTDFDQGGLAYCDLKPEISTDGNYALKDHWYPVTVKVSQLGTKKCASSIIRYKDYGNNVQKDYMLPEILPGETYTAVYNITWSSYGNKLFEVTVDPGNKLQHENKQNNKTHKTIKVR